MKILMGAMKVKNKILIKFGDMIADMLCNKKLKLILKESRKIIISLVFILKSCFTAPKETPY